VYRRLVAILVWLLPLAAYGQTLPTGPRFINPVITGGTITGADTSGASVTATGSSTARTPADRAADVLNVKDGTGATLGAKGDGKCANAYRCPTAMTTAITVGTNALSVGSATFTSADVGKTIIIGHAGATPATGSVTSIPVTSQGTSYTSLPTCAITGPGTSATCFPQGVVQSATVTTPASVACANSGTQTFTVVSGVGRWATVTGTVTGGVLAGALTVTDGGFYSTLPAATSLVSGAGGCTTNPSVTLTYAISTAVALGNYGTGYDNTTTAALTGGSPSVAATLGTPVVYAPIPPLVTTIASVVSSTSVTLATNALTTVSGSQPIFWATDDFVALQAAFNAANVQNKNIYIPTGRYYTSAPINPGNGAWYGSLSIRGDGMFSSEFWFYGISGQDKQIFLNRNAATSFPRKGSLQFQDFGMRGLLDFGLVQNGLGTDAMILLNYTSLDFNRIHCYMMANGCSANEGVDMFNASNTVMEYIDASSWRCRSCFNVTIVGNHFSHTDDDSVDIHQASYLQPGVGLAGSIRQNITVTGNTFVDAVPIHSLDARNLTVSGNTCDRCKLYFLNAGSDAAGEGINQTFNINVSDNVITNTIGRAPFNGTGNNIAQSVIGIQTWNPQAGALDPNFIPGNIYRSGTGATAGTVIPPFSYYNKSVANSQDPTVNPIPPAVGVNVHDNIISRTLPAVEAYSAWGYGAPISERLGLGVDVPVTDVGLRPISGITIPFTALASKAHSNVVMNTQRGITVGGTGGAGPALSEVELADNTIYDAIEYGIFVTGATNENRLNIHGGRITGDPYRISPGRAGVSGAWSFSYADSYGIFGSGAFIRVSNVAFEEVYQPIGGTATGYQLLDNWVYGNPFTTGSWTSSNLGVGVPPNGGSGYHYLQVSAGSASPGNYGAASTGHALEAAAAPTSGFHAQGEFIRSTAPGTCTCQGWSMLTTGTAWVSGTDYKVVPIQ
jgi:hypothetical protein